MFNQFVQSTRRHLTRRLESLDLKVEEHNELSQLIANDVRDFEFFFFFSFWV